MSDITVELIDHMGCDLSVVNAARVSFSKRSSYLYDDEMDDCYLSVKDTKLLAYLTKHNHWSPFSHAFASFRISAPIFVARQLAKHQVGLSWNEVSRRYVDSSPEFYVPETWRKRAANVKQGSSEEAVDLSKQLAFPESTDAGWDDYLLSELEDEHRRRALILYDGLLRVGVCPEQARMVLPQSMMTEWIWSGSLYAFARVCNLRCKPDTQAETRLVADRISAFMDELFPASWKELTHG